MKIGGKSAIAVGGIDAPVDPLPALAACTFAVTDVFKDKFPSLLVLSTVLCVFVLDKVFLYTSHCGAWRSGSLGSGLVLKPV